MKNNLYIINKGKIQLLFGKYKKKRKSQFFHVYIIKALNIFILSCLCYYIFSKNPKYKIIEVDIHLSKVEGGGPVQLIKGIAKILPYRTKDCLFIPSSSINLQNAKNSSNYFYISAPYFDNNTMFEWKKINRNNDLLLGPNYVPIHWKAFPIQSSWREKILERY